MEIDDLDELDIGPIRKRGMAFKERPERARVLRPDFAAYHDDAVRISHRDRGVLDFPSTDLEPPAEHLAALPGRHRDRRRVEARPPHLGRDPAAVSGDRAFDLAARRRHPEPLRPGHPAQIAQVACEDAKPVSALLGFRAVRVEDPERGPRLPGAGTGA